MRRFTNDLADYSRRHFDRTADGRMLALVVESISYDLETVDTTSAASSTRSLTTGGLVRGVTFGSDGGIYYVSGGRLLRFHLRGAHHSG